MALISRVLSSSDSVAGVLQKDTYGVIPMCCRFLKRGNFHAL